MSNRKNQGLLCFILILLSLPTLAKPLFYAHRGGRALWPENTLCAFKQTLKTKADFIDMDVQFSADDVMMITHNSGLAADLTQLEGHWVNKKTPIRHLTMQELQRYELGQLKPDSKTAKQFPLQKSMHHCYMPTLAQGIDFIKLNDARNIGFQIELKVPLKQEQDKTLPTKYAKHIVALLEDKAIIERTEIQSFDFRVLSEIAKLNPKVKLAFLTEKQPGDKKLFKQISALNGSLWEPASEDVTEKSIQLAHKMNLRVVVWGLPTEPEQERKVMRKLIKAGVDGIITDNPKLI